jgi:hypothetical protein
MEDPAPAAVRVDEIVERYIALRGKKAELKSAYERQVAEVEQAMRKCERFLLAQLNSTGTESQRTRAGTVYKEESVSVSIADWDAYLNWVRENGMYSMLEKRAAKSAVQEYRNVHNDLPPGVNYSTHLVVHVRRN